MIMKWRTIPGFSNYEVSEYGDIRRHIDKPRIYARSLEPGEFLKPHFERGYQCYCLTSDFGYRAKLANARRQQKAVDVSDVSSLGSMEF